MPEPSHRRAADGRAALRLLLDTHILISALAKASRLSGTAKDTISDTGSDIHSGAASIREIAIEARLGRAGFAVEPEQIPLAAEAGSRPERPVTAADALRARHLPSHRADPFDRRLVVQAIAAGAVLLTSDVAVPAHSPLVRLV